MNERIEKLERRVSEIEYANVIQSLHLSGNKDAVDMTLSQVGDLHSKINLLYNYLKLEIHYDPEKTYIAKRGQKKR